jgi:lysophospholipase L1-like esterase
MNFRYVLGAIISLPLLPIMYFQGKKIRASVPRLPEAKDTEGYSQNTSGNKLTVLTIGESTIAGVGVKTHREGFSGTLADELAFKLNASINWKVYARSGYTANRVIEKIIPKISEESVDLIVIGLGGNDAFTLNSPRKWKKHIHDFNSCIKVEI